MRSANFYLMGDVGEGDLRRVAGRSNSFAPPSAVILPKATVTTATPTTVLVFRSHRNYQPFKPLYNGKADETRRRLFPPGGPAGQLITLTTETRGDGSEDDVRDHLPRARAPDGEQHGTRVAGVVQRRAGGILPDAGGGAATARRSIVGRIHAPHVLLLREQFLPVDQLVAVDHRLAALQRAREGVDLLRRVVGAGALPAAG